MNQDNYKINQIFAPSTCVSAEMLLKYADGELNEKEIHIVERHLVDCPFCEDALEGITIAGTDKFSSILAKVNSTIEARIAQEKEKDATVIDFRTEAETNVNTGGGNSGTSRKWFRMISVAASVMLIAVVGYFTVIHSPLTPSSIANEYFSPFAGLNTRTEVKVKEGDVFGEAKSLYASKNYVDAAPLFDQVDSIEAIYIAGNCYYMIGKYELAAERFLKVISFGDGYSDDSEFDLAMTYLMLEKVDKAKALLEDIVARDRHNFDKHAAKVLAKVNHL